MSAIDLFVLRHGEPEDRTIFYGQRDVGLSDRGRQHVRDQVAFFSKAPATIVSSDLSRCRFGAEAIAAAHGLHVHTRAALREMHLGVLEGVPIADALKSHPDLAGRSYADMLDYAFEGGGETVRQVDARAKPCVEQTIREADPEGGAVILYVHNTIARLVLSWAAGGGPQGYVRFEQRYGAINRIRVWPGDDDPWARSVIAWSNRAPRSAPS